MWRGVWTLRNRAPAKREGETPGERTAGPCRGIALIFASGVRVSGDGGYWQTMDGSDPTLAQLLAERQWLARLARRLVADPAAAEDLAQETWLAASRARRCAWTVGSFRRCST